MLRSVDVMDGQHLDFRADAAAPDAGNGRAGPLGLPLVDLRLEVVNRRHLRGGVRFQIAQNRELFLNGRSLGVKAREFPAQGTSGGWNSYALPVVRATHVHGHAVRVVPGRGLQAFCAGLLRPAVYVSDGALAAGGRAGRSGWERGGVIEASAMAS